MASMRDKAPPPSMYDDDALRPLRQPSRFNPVYWGWKRWAAAALAVIVIVVAIVVPLTVIKDNRYPDYTALTYSLNDTYAGSNFFSMFTYGNGTEQTNGFVNYVTEEGAAYSNLTYITSSSTAVLRVDTTVTTTAGRPSVKLFSKHNYTRGLFIFDVVHTPYGCGTWPALWLTDADNWPMNGEIDVLEAVNQANIGNQMTLHTTKDCSMKSKRKETGTVLSTNCLNSTNYNAGCGVRGKPATFGSALNNAGGGIYALEWRTEGIRMWFFPRSDIPSDITSLTPDPSSWGTALSDFPNTNCDIDSHFKNNKIIVNIDLCGDWAGQESVYTTQFGCPGTSCAAYVGANPGVFGEAYWEFASWRVYTANA